MAVTSIDAYICHNIYLFAVAITDVMNIHRLAGAKNNLLLLITVNAATKNQCHSLLLKSLLPTKQKIEIIVTF